jgi:hypothetical protein
VKISTFLKIINVETIKVVEYLAKLETLLKNDSSPYFDYGVLVYMIVCYYNKYMPSITFVDLS